jgi:hypothetical protein
MRITHEALLKAARDIVNQRARGDRNLVAVYVVGSLLAEEPLLGGTTDIDLVFIQNQAPSQPREVIRLTTEVTLDIAYYNETEYRQPRHLRINPWLGSSLCETRIMLYDTQHWFEFTQSSVGSQFYIPENVLSRSRLQAEKARSIWLALQSGSGPYLQSLLSFLKSVKSAANAVASLSGAPLTERRFLLNFSERAGAIGRPGLAAGLSGLLGSDLAEPERMRTWLPGWHAALQALAGGKDIPVRLSPARFPYYERAVEALLGSDHPQAALWPLLRTWTLACSCLAADSPHLAAWVETCEHLRLGPDHLGEKLTALDAYLDNIEETLDKWGEENGV